VFDFALEATVDQKVQKRLVIAVDPFRCRMWRLHDRLEELITDETCSAEIQSFSKYGQLIPVLGRKIAGDLHHDIELIYGARRLYAARQINRPLLVEVREMTDREAIIAMDVENRQRLDLSPYERGMSYARLLRSGCFGSQDELAQALKISPSQVSKLLKLGRLPSVVVNAFSSAAQISEAWGMELAEALSDPIRSDRMIRKAREIGSVVPRPAPRDIYTKLMSASVASHDLATLGQDRIVADGSGKALFRIRHYTRSIAIVMPRTRISKNLLGCIEAAVAKILQCERGPESALSGPMHIDCGGVKNA
jgi:ParB family chromosome partitioning protein